MEHEKRIKNSRNFAARRLSLLIRSQQFHIGCAVWRLFATEFLVARGHKKIKKVFVLGARALETTHKKHVYCKRSQHG
jgi:hypothetical protein